MDPVSMIVSAVAAGASAALGDTAKQVVKDAYAGLKTLLVRKYDGTSQAIQLVERNPSSIAKRDALKEEVEPAKEDTEVLEAATLLARVIEEHEPAKAAAIGVNIQNVVAQGNFFLQRVSAEGVKVQGVTTKTGDFVMTDIDARKR